MDWYLESHIMTKGLSEAVCTSYRSTIKNLKVVFGDVNPLELSEDHQDEYIRQRKLGTIGRRGPAMMSTIDHEITVLIAAIHRGIKKRKLHRRCVPVIEKKQQYQARIYWITRAEAARLLRAARRLHRIKAKTFAERRKMSDGELFIWLALKTGQRRDAILNLKYHTQVNFSVGEVDFQDPAKRETSKRNARQQMTPSVFRVLRRRFNERPPHRPTVFPAGIDMNRIFNKIARAADLPEATPHTCRHSFITWALAASADLYYLSAVANCSVSTLLSTYAHSVPAVSLAKLKKWVSDKNARTSGARV